MGQTPPQPLATAESKPHHHHHRTRLFGHTSLIALGLLTAALTVCFIFQWTTRDAMANLPYLHGRGTTRMLLDQQKTVVDLKTWQTLKELAVLAVTTEETNYALQATRLADHDTDQAFAAALRQANLKQRTLTGEALALSKKVAALQQIVKADDATVRNLKATQPAPPPQSTDDDPDALPSDLELAQAQLSLDQNELSDAQQNLARASGDERGRIQQELTAHEADQKKFDALTGSDGQNAIASARRYGTLYGRTGAWMNQLTRYNLLQDAIQQAKSEATSVTTKHDALESGSKVQNGDTDSVSRLATLRRMTTQHQLLSIYEDRIQTQQQLAAVYAKWSAQVQLQHRILGHLILQSLAWIAIILILAIVANAIVMRLMERPSLDRRRARTLSTILRLAIQIFTLLIVLLTIFGPPSQISTVLGLATAGLTVALQDFILAFVGWFILMGRNGIRVGDTVEISGVGGEVVEIGLFRTTLMETGNWTDKGHPTGRRVAFNNRFAISGQFFNFSTTGQWMWDELTVTVPATEDTYAAVERIHKAVEKETAEDARLAESEWQRVSRQNALSQFSAATAVNVRPAASGVNLVVRYITRASTRFERRNRLYQSVMEALPEPTASTS